MKLCRFWRPRAGAALGLIVDGKVHDLASAGETGSLTGILSDPELHRRLEKAAQSVAGREGLAYASLDIPPDPDKPHLLAPLTEQEVWAAGVTYLRSRDARIEESAQGGSFYDKVYAAERPELFFKATPHRVSGPNAPIRIRKDSHWNVPEPEIALVIGPNGNLAGYTIGNDVSSRDIEGENPLYLPQAKVYKGSCALGPAILTAESVSDVRTLSLRLSITRSGRQTFEGNASIAQMKRSFEELIAFLCREQEFPAGAILLTGTGIVPPDAFTLQSGDVVEIAVPEIGILRNPVA